MALFLYIYRSCASQWNISAVVHGYGLRQQDVSSCQEFRHQSNSGVLLSMCRQHGTVSHQINQTFTLAIGLYKRGRTHKLICPARQLLVTKHAQMKFKTFLLHNEECHPALLWCLCGFSAVYKCSDLLTYLFTYLPTYLLEHKHVLQMAKIYTTLYCTKITKLSTNINYNINIAHPTKSMEYSQLNTAH